MKARPKIGLDAGHGGDYTGTYSIDTKINGLYEEDYTLELALLIDKHLRRNGFETYLTRKSDMRPGDVSERAKACAKEKCDFAVSLHFNGSNDVTANGTEVYVPYRETAANIEVGFLNCLKEYFRERKPFARSNNANNRNEILDKKMNVSTKKFEATANKSEYFGFVRTAWAQGLSADLLEICFLTNRKDYDTYMQNKEKIAEGLAKAIVEGFGKTFKQENNYPKTRPVNKSKVDMKL
ncbi:MAG: N-acetylmuramoyl-L-alanine amidase [Clostridia bacterium]|nr:N-acetylmuramoyl-L-alanine amidase [Clostridia bacterium]